MIGNLNHLIFILIYLSKIIFISIWTKITFLFFLETTVCHFVITPTLASSINSSLGEYCDDATKQVKFILMRQQSKFGRVRMQIKGGRGGQFEIRVQQDRAACIYGSKTAYSAKHALQNNVVELMYHHCNYSTQGFFIGGAVEMIKFTSLRRHALKYFEMNTW